MINTTSLQDAKVFQLSQTDKELIASYSSSGKWVERFLELYELNVKDVDYQSREEFKKYLSEQNVSKKRRLDCISTFDNIKIDFIGKSARVADESTLKKWLRQDCFFLLYFPDDRIAKKFKATRRKEDLFWDLSDINEELKEQTKRIIILLIQNKSDLHERNRYLKALKQFIVFCNKRRIWNLEQIENEDANQFKLYAQRNNTELRDACSKIIEYCRKWLFLTDKKVNYRCPVWYMERFCLIDERINKASPIRRISFLNVECGAYRDAIQDYALFLIGNMYYSISTVRKRVGDIKDFLIFLSEEKVHLKDVNNGIIAKYFGRLSDKMEQSSTIDRYLISIRFFYNHLVNKRIINECPIKWKKYIKGKNQPHVERYLPHSVCADRDNCFRYMPEDLGLMYLINSRTGARISEICMLRANAFIVNGDDAFMRVFQTKMKSDHVMTISAVIARMVMTYIEARGFKAEDYIFLNANGEPYNEQTYRSRLNKIFKKYGNNNHSMRAHDYRHKVFTDLYDSGVDLQTIRQVANHDDTEMTSRYIDKSMKRSVRKQREYHESKE